MSSPAERREMIALPDGTYVEAWVGYRQWNMLVSSGQVNLHPLTAGGASRVAMSRSGRGRTTSSRLRWKPGEVQEAQCLCISHETAPRCGFYAWMAQPKVMMLRPHAVWGEVYLWGDVVIHEKGYRAQYALPAALYVFEAMPERNRMLIELAALQYAVPTVLIDNQWMTPVMLNGWSNRV